MTERPLLFSTPMVQALLRAARGGLYGKYETRRIVKPQPEPTRTDENGGVVPDCQAPFWRWKKGVFDLMCDPMDLAVLGEMAPIKVGERIWARETWAHNHNGPGYLYLADGTTMVGMWRPSIHMPRKAARIFMTCTGVRAERLQEITDKGAMREGLFLPASAFGDAVNHYEKLWGEINGPTSWQENPWVWVYQWETVEVTA